MTASLTDLIDNSFPIINTCSYLNTASSGLMPRKLIEFRKQYNEGIHSDYTKIDYLEDEKIDSLREKIKKYFHAESSEVALLPNFSIGLNFIVEAIPKNSKVVLLNGDYPSVNLPFEQRNFEIAYAEINEDLEQNILETAAKFNPDYLALSIVQFISGILIDFEFLKELKSKYPNLHIIGDATQYLGTEDFKFNASAFSAIGSSGYKWFNAGTGNAFFILKPELIDILKPKTLGSNSLLTKPNGPVRKVGFLEPGHFDMHSLKSLGVALDFHFMDIGIDAVEKQIKSISAVAKTEFINRNLLKKEVVNRKTHSSIFNLKGDEKILNKLHQHQIIAALRGDGIRVGFQYFNNQADLDKLLEVFDLKK
jgi:selenocysteine lyase/cysteine desulfurase